MLRASLLLGISLLLSLSLQAEAKATYRNKEDKAYWMNDAQEELNKQLDIKLLKKQAKNIVFFLGDGMSIGSVTATRILKGSKTGNFEREKLSWEEFDFSAFSKTYNTDSVVTDSAASGTAYLNGVKTNQGVIGLDVNADRGNCSAQLDESIYTTSIAQWFLEAGRSAGFVTTSTVTHATPAGSYAHIAERYWEDDSYVEDYPVDPEICDDIAEQLVFREPGKSFKVIMGGGRCSLTPTDEPDVEDGTPGNRRDEKNLIYAWLEEKEKIGASAAYVWNKDDLLAVDLQKTDYLMGLFAFSHMDTALNRDTTQDPTLPEMTKAAIEMLSKDPNGFFLLVEAARIDMMHHENRVQESLHEALDLDEAVSMAVSMTDPEETIILVTADHGHTLDINGYAERQADVFGYGGTSVVDDKKYTILSYGNGPGFHVSQDGRREPTDEDIHDTEYQYTSGIPMTTATHDGSDVGIWARGPFAHLFTGVHEESYIPHALAYAACVGQGRQFCDETVN